MTQRAVFREETADPSSLIPLILITFIISIHLPLIHIRRGPNPVFHPGYLSRCPSEALARQPGSTRFKNSDGGREARQRRRRNLQAVPGR
ncbi:hypothetical protein E2C01_033209 [Portunus trituberculatus]|uniref:Uncharacterized protein n=1 Tax=Portunus trituberculatus TaxID=210409 RepID=A0A5B7F4Y9_PORTR|nr:hypothetical protein [Portunus trituberculatus]